MLDHLKSRNQSSCLIIAFPRKRWSLIQNIFVNNLFLIYKNQDNYFWNHENTKIIAINSIMLRIKGTYLMQTRCITKRYAAKICIFHIQGVSFELFWNILCMVWTEGTNISRNFLANLEQHLLKYFTKASC